MSETEMLQADHFLPHVNKTFRVRGGRHSLTLNQVDARRVDEREAKLLPRPPFILVFSGPPGDVLREGMYAFDVDGGPSFEFYVMPIETRVRDRQDYQAAFN